MFNVLVGTDSRRYVDSIRRAFAAADVYRPSGTGNLIVVASAQGPLAAEPDLRRQARELDRRGGYGFSFERVLDDRERKPGSP